MDNNVVSIDSREELRNELQGKPSGGVYLTTIQKFTEDTQLLTDRSNVICISDEAHRSQVNLDMKVRITDEGVNLPDFCGILTLILFLEAPGRAARRMKTHTNRKHG